VCKELGWCITAGGGTSLTNSRNCRVEDDGDPANKKEATRQMFDDLEEEMDGNLEESLNDLLGNLEGIASRLVQQVRRSSSRRSADEALLDRADSVLRRVIQQLRGIHRSTRRMSVQLTKSSEGDEWLDMYSGKSRRFRGLAQIARKVQVEKKIIKHWTHQVNSKAPTTFFSSVPDCSHLVRSWDNVDVFKIEKEHQQPLTSIFMSIWYDRHLGRLSKAKREQAQRFISSIEGAYKPNPYHNRIHAADVTQAAYYMWSVIGEQSHMADYFVEIDVLVMIFAAAVHDVGHPAVRNDFLIKTRNSLALRYNDRQVLENFHCATAFEMLAAQEIPLLEHGLPSPPVSAMRARIVDMVLATDMAVHKQTMEDLSDQLRCHENIQDVSKLVVEKNILHLADIAHPLRPFYLHEEWTRRVTDEFFAQGDKEKQLGLQPATLLDRDKCPSLGKSQLGFINFVIVPQWKAVKPLLGDAAAAQDNDVQNNIQRWEEIKQQEEADSRKSGGM